MKSLCSGNHVISWKPPPSKTLLHLRKQQPFTCTYTYGTPQNIHVYVRVCPYETSLQSKIKATEQTFDTNNNIKTHKALSVELGGYPQNDELLLKCQMNSLRVH